MLLAECCTCFQLMSGGDTSLLSDCERNKHMSA